MDGNGGADFGLLGTGHDTFVWDPGDGSDIVEGQGGTDTLLFNGSGGSENFDFSANGNRLRFFRDLGNIIMDTDEVERVDLEALGGASDAVVNDLTPAPTSRLANIDLEGVLGGGCRRRTARHHHRQGHRGRGPDQRGLRPPGRSRSTASPPTCPPRMRTSVARPSTAIAPEAEVTLISPRPRCPWR